MTLFKLVDRFGATLTGREFGKTAYEEIKKGSIGVPVALDFGGVASLGSSFADEVVTPFAQVQGSKIVVLNANAVVQSCLRDVRDETGIQIILGSLAADGSIREERSL